MLVELQLARLAVPCDVTAHVVPGVAHVLQFELLSKFSRESIHRRLVFGVGKNEEFNVWGGRGFDDFVPGEVTKTAPSGDGTT